MRRRRDSVATLAVGAVALLALFVATVLEGLTGASAALVCAVAFVVPGDALRRAIPAPVPHGVGETIAIDFLGSCVVLVALGGLLNTLGALTRGTTVIVTLVVVVALFGYARGRGGRTKGVPTSLRAVGLTLTFSAISVCLFHIAPHIGDRIFLGQMRTSIEIVQHHRIPSTTWTFGAHTAFPINYVFYDLIFGVITLLGGFHEWTGWKLMAGALRLEQLGLFAIVWYLVGRAVLRRFPSNLLTKVCAFALPALLLFNLGLINKFREPLVEGFGVVVLGVALWARLRSDDEPSSTRPWYLGLSVLGVALLAGIHFPVFSEAVFLIGPLVVIGSGTALATDISSRLKAIARAAAPYIGGTVGALIAMQVLAGATPITLASDPVSRRVAFRAYLLYLGDPLTTRSLSAFVMQRWSSSFLLTQDPFTDTAAVVGIVALIGILAIGLRLRAERRVIAWLLLTSFLTSVYVGTGFLWGRTVVTPWNAITRNAFYIWFPIVIAGILGLRVALTAIEFRRVDRPVRRKVKSGTRVMALAALLFGLLYPFASAYWATFTDNGWIIQSQMTPDGERALRWVSDHTPAHAVILTSEDTFGSSLVARRQMVTEGFATLESGAVTRAAVKNLTEATEFLLPAHAPRILVEQHVDYVVARSGVYVPAELGGYPLLGNYYSRLLPVLSSIVLDQIPYLHLVHRSGAVGVYRVARNEIPPTSMVSIGPDQTPPPCASGVCLAYQTIRRGDCPPEQTSTERNLCIIRQVGATGPK